jgi:hypothetical protein
LKYTGEGIHYQITTTFREVLAEYSTRILEMQAERTQKNQEKLSAKKRKGIVADDEVADAFPMRLEKIKV